MPDFFVEKYASREIEDGDTPSATFMYLLGRTDDPLAAEALVLANAPARFGGLYQQRLRCRPLGGGVWEGQLDYNLRSRQTTHNPANSSPDGGNEQQANDPLGPEVEVDLAGVTRHVTQDIVTGQQVKVAGDVRGISDFRGAIGVHRSGGSVTVAGCDVTVGGMTWTETWTFLAPYVTWAYMDRLEKLIGRVNHAAFRGFAAGEVMFMGAKSPAAANAKRKIAYTFRRERNVMNVFLNVPGGLVDAANNPAVLIKYGHEYLAAEYEQKQNANGDGMMPNLRCLRAHVVGPDEDETDPDFIGLGRTQANRRDFAGIIRIGS